MNWQPTAALNLTVHRDGMSLVLIVGRNVELTWHVLAVETPVPRADRSIEQHMLDTLDHHAHQALVPQPTLSEALALAERYAHWWLGSRATHFECACEPIAAEPRA